MIVAAAAMRGRPASTRLKQGESLLKADSGIYGGRARRRLRRRGRGGARGWDIRTGARGFSYGISKLFFPGVKLDIRSIGLVELDGLTGLDGTIGIRLGRPPPSGGGRGVRGALLVHPFEPRVERVHGFHARRHRRGFTSRGRDGRRQHRVRVDEGRPIEGAFSAIGQGAEKAKQAQGRHQ